MTTITSIKSGSWSDAATWNSGTVPEAADDIIISAGHIVTLDADRTLAGWVNFTLADNAQLTVNPDITLTIGASGNNTAAGAYLVFNPGSKIMGSGTFNFYTGHVTVAGTIDNPVLVGDSVRFTRPSTGAGHVVWDAEYLVLDTATAESFYFGGSGSNFSPGYNRLTSSSYVFKNCVFKTVNALYFGTGSTRMEVDFDFRNCDFRDSPLVYVSTSTTLTDGKPVGLRRTKGCTFYKAGSFMDLRRSAETGDGDGWIVDDCVHVNAKSVVTNKKTVYSNGFYTQNVAGADQALYNTVADSASIGDYVYIPGEGPSAENPHIVTIPTVRDGVIECDSPNEADFTMGTVLLSGMLGLGYGALKTSTSSAAQDMLMENCTHVIKEGGGESPVYVMYLQENSRSPSITFGKRMRNCLMSCLGSDTVPAFVRAQGGSGAPQEFDISYCCKWNVTSWLRQDPAYNINVGGEALFDANPQFVDSSRGFLSWIRTVSGNGSATYDDAVALMLRKNGYNPETGRQESDYAFTPAAAELTAWVREGFVPQNTALEAAGEDGAYVGAMPVGGESPVPAPAPVIIAPSLITGTSGATGVWSVDFGGGTGTVTWVDPGGTERQLGYTASLADWTVTVTANGTITAARTGGESTLTGSITLTAKNTEGKTASRSVSVRLRGTVPPPAPGNEAGPLTFSPLTFGKG